MQSLARPLLALAASILVVVPLYVLNTVFHTFTELQQFAASGRAPDVVLMLGVADSLTFVLAAMLLALGLVLFLMLPFVGRKERSNHAQDGHLDPQGSRDAQR